MSGIAKLRLLLENNEAGQLAVKDWCESEMTKLMLEVVEEFTEPDVYAVQMNGAPVDAISAVLDYGAIRRARRIYNILKDPSILIPSASDTQSMEGLESAYGADSLMKQQENRL